MWHWQSASSTSDVSNNSWRKFGSLLFWLLYLWYSVHHELPTDSISSLTCSLVWTPSVIRRTSMLHRREYGNLLYVRVRYLLMLTKVLPYEDGSMLFIFLNHLYCIAHVFRRFWWTLGHFCIHFILCFLVMHVFATELFVLCLSSFVKLHFDFNFFISYWTVLLVLFVQLWGSLIWCWTVRTYGFIFSFGNFGSR